jgi:hypothetical protein
MTATALSAPSTAPIPAPRGTLPKLFTDPQQINHLISEVEHGALRAAPFALGALIAAFACFVVLRRRWRARIHARFTQNARVIAILAPPHVDVTGAEALWSHLLGLLRPAVTRLTQGQPHLSFEYCWSRAGLSVRIWVPGNVPPGMVERAIAAAWPGAHTATVPADEPSAGVLPDRAEATGGALRLARSEILPLQAKHDADPLRALLGAAAGLGRDEHAAVQILARPVTGRRVRKARRAVRALKYGRETKASARILDALTPRLARTTAAGTGVVAVAMDPAQAAEYRAAAQKAASSLWEIQIRYAAALIEH